MQYWVKIQGWNIFVVEGKGMFSFLKSLEKGPKRMNVG